MESMTIEQAISRHAELTNVLLKAFVGMKKALVMYKTFTGGMDEVRNPKELRELAAKGLNVTKECDEALKDLDVRHLEKALIRAQQHQTTMFGMVTECAQDLEENLQNTRLRCELVLRSLGSVDEPEI